MVDNVPCLCGPSRCVAIAQPALCTKGNHPKIWATGPPSICHHIPPTQGIQDDEHPPHLAGLRHQACQSSDPVPSVGAAVGGDT